MVATVCFSWLSTLYFELGVIFDKIHGHTWGEFSFPCSFYTHHLLNNTQLNINSVQGINHILLIFLFIKRQRNLDKMTENKEESLFKGGDTQFLELFIVMYTPNYFCSGVYLSQLQASVQPFMHVPWQEYTIWLLIKLCDNKMNACPFSRIGSCRQTWKLTREWRSSAHYSIYETRGKPGAALQTPL